MAISFERAFSIHDQALVLRGRRASILASNIANADTPNYKARDFEFKTALRHASDATNKPNFDVDVVIMAQTNHAHLAPAKSISQLALQYRVPLHPSLDGNSVDAHVEQAEFAENSLLYQTSFNFLNGKIRGLMKALKGE